MVTRPERDRVSPAGGLQSAAYPPGEPSKRRPELIGPFGRRAIRLGRVFGIEVGLDWSWLVIFLLITVSLSQQFAAAHEDWSRTVTLLGAVLASLLFFTSILLHELGHSVTSQAVGVPVRSITLFLFGGLASLDSEPKRPRDLFVVGAAGPAVSVALGGLFLVAGRLMPTSVVWGELLAAVFGWLGTINLILAGFNLFPGTPLDGGHLLRAVVWAWTGSAERATRVAAAMGVLFATGLIGMGFFISLLAGNLIGGLWLVFIGWFLMTAARRSTIQSELEHTLGAIRADEVMNTEPPTVQASDTVAALIAGPVLHQGRRYLLVEEPGQPAGLITLHEIKRVPAAERETTRARDIMLPAERIVTVAPDATLWEVLRRMGHENVNQVPVMTGDRLVGVISREQLVGIIKNQSELAHSA